MRKLMRIIDLPSFLDKFFGFQDLDDGKMCWKPVYLRVNMCEDCGFGLDLFLSDRSMEKQPQDIHMEGGTMLISDRGNPAHLEAWQGVSNNQECS